MDVAIIDADLISRSKHRFPNLACMKLSGYYKSLGAHVVLKTDYENLCLYDKVFISKVFTDTPVDDNILSLQNVEYGGTGFFYDKAPALPDAIEHHMPDYNLYDEYVANKISCGSKRDEFKYYLDYSIGFLTRGCFRQCEFCVNKNYTRVYRHSPISEFLEPSRKNICLLDDNFLGCSEWKTMLLELQRTNKPFQFKQGLDERILTDEKCELIFSSKYDGDFIFAFDNIADQAVIEKKARLIRKYYKLKGHHIKFYVLCGFDRQNKYDADFWRQDIKDTFDRIFILAKYNFKPYIMRFEKYKDSPLYGTYVNLARWCNQPSFFYNFSYKDFCEKNNVPLAVKGKISATWRYFEDLIALYDEFEQYVNIVPKTLVLDYSQW